jgi:hypothetical protein
MSAVKLTDEQRAVVHHEGDHARVSAVAGSGKTHQDVKPPPALSLSPGD